MTRTVKIMIKGRGPDTDAPTVDDLLDQLRDHFEILRGVEEAIAGSVQIEWRVINASANTPIAIEAAPFSRQFAVNVDRRVDLVAQATATGLRSLQFSKARPAYFSERILSRAEMVFERVTNGLADTVVSFGPDIPTIEINRSSGYVATTNIGALLRPPAKTYQELGSIEGIAHSLSTDGWGNRIVRVRHRLTGDLVPCRVKGAALEQIEAKRVGEVWRECRLQLSGTLYYKAVGKMHRVDAGDVRFLRDRRELPDIEDILDETFTGGRRTEEYLELLRDDRLS